MLKFFRLTKIVLVAWRYGLDQLLLSSFKYRGVKWLVRFITLGGACNGHAASACAWRLKPWGRYLSSLVRS
jgi:hypothetical protein